MPFYEFRCTECARIFISKIVIGNAQKPLYCPTCGSTKLSRLASIFAGVISDIDSDNEDNSSSDKGSNNQAA